MSSRRLARELAVILLPQLPKDKNKLGKAEFEALIVKAVHMLVDYAKYCLADANAFVVKAQEQSVEIELNHEDNSKLAMSLKSVPVNTHQLKEMLDLLDRAMHLISEALDIPEMALQGNALKVELDCPSCGNKHDYHVRNGMAVDSVAFLNTLVTTYMENKVQIDEFIAQAKAKWRTERMVSIDRDILRLACAEALYIHEVPVNVAISEAIELSHRFADETAAKFINGILSDLASKAENFRKTGEFDSQIPQAVSEDTSPIV